MVCFLVSHNQENMYTNAHQQIQQILFIWRVLSMFNIQDIILLILENI